MTNNQITEVPAPGEAGVRPRRDRGLSLVELLATIALLGIVAGAVLTALSTSISASSRQREMANAVAWLQSSTAVLEIMGKQTCTTDIAPIVAAYQEQLREEAINNDGWPVDRLSVDNVQFWNGASFDSVCSGEVQLLTLRVTSPSGRVTQTLDVVVDDPYAELAQSTSPGVDPPTMCTLSNLAMVDKKGVGAPFVLKKPSTTKPSQVKEHPITVTLTTSGVCQGKLEVRFLWPHNCHDPNKPEKCHYHLRKVKMKLVKDSTNTYSGKIGKKNKWTTTQTADMFVMEHRKKSKRWTPINSGEVPQAMRFQ